jgi:lysophospholipase L1-like esterase
MRERWVMHIEQRVGTVTSTSDGIGIGIRSVNPNYAPGIAGILVTNSTGNAGKLLLLDISSGGSVIASSASAISFSAGDTLVFELERDRFTFMLRGYNRTTGSATISIVPFEYSVAPSPVNVLPNTGTFSVFSVGGTQLMTNLSILSKETKRAPLMCIGDSKTAGYFSSNIGRYGSLLYNYFTPTIVHGGSADRLDELLETTDEVLSINPINVTLTIGSNDIGYGATVPQTFAKYKQYVTILENNGINVFHLLPLYQTTLVAELNELADSIRANYVASSIADCRTPMQECPLCYLSPDLVHPNAAGDSLIFQTIINSGLLRKYYKSPLLGSNPTLDFVLFNGNVSSQEAKMGHIYINTTSAIADESLTINGMAYVRKNQNANTYFVLENATSGNAAATSTTLYNDVSASLQEAIFSSTTNDQGDILAGSTYTKSTSTAGHSIAVSAGPLKFLFTTSNVESARFNTSGELQLGSTFDKGAYTLQNTGGLYQSGAVTMNLGSDATGDIYYRNSGGALTRLGVGSNGDVLTLASGLPSWSAAGGATTIYSGDGTLSGNRTVTGSANSLTFSGMNLFRVYANYLYQAKADGTRAYASAIDPSSTGRQSWQFGYSPFTRGVGLYVDTLNNVGLGDNTLTNMPLYTTGNSAFVRNGFQSQEGNFYGITNVTTNTTIGLTDNFIAIDATSGAITITLPAASTAFGASMGLDLIFKRLDNTLANSITVQRSGSDTIDGATSFTLTTQYEAKRLRAISSSAWGLY